MRPSLRNEGLKLFLALVEKDGGIELSTAEGEDLAFVAAGSPKQPSPES